MADRSGGRGESGSGAGMGWSGVGHITYGGDWPEGGKIASWMRIGLIWLYFDMGYADLISVTTTMGMRRASSQRYILKTPHPPASPSAPISPLPPGDAASREALSSAASSRPKPITSLVSDGAMIPSSYAGDKISFTASPPSIGHLDAPISVQSSKEPNSVPRSSLATPSIDLPHLSPLESVFPKPSASPRRADRDP